MKTLRSFLTVVAFLIGMVAAFSMQPNSLSTEVSLWDGNNCSTATITVGAGCEVRSSGTICMHDSKQVYQKNFCNNPDRAYRTNP